MRATGKTLLVTIGVAFGLALATGAQIASAASIEGESVSRVTRTDATLEARLVTSGINNFAYYQFQIVASPSEYAPEFTCPTEGFPAHTSLCLGVEARPGALPIRSAEGADEQAQAVSLDLASAGQVLKPGTTYHYRVIMAPGVGEEDLIRWELPIIYGADQSFTTPSSITRAEYKNWTVAGSLAPKQLGQQITLPAGATFSGTGELNSETGAGTVTGNLSVPAFSETFKLFGLLPVSVGLTLKQSGAFEGSIAKSATVSGEETLTVPAKLNLAINSIGLLGLKIPTRCSTGEAVSLALADTLSAEELLSEGWKFGGSATVPKLKCEGGVLGSLFGQVLSALLSGPEASYSLSFSQPTP